VVVLMSPAAAASRNVSNEINLALSLGKPLLAVHVEETVLPAGLDLQLGPVQAILAWQMDPAAYAAKLAVTLALYASAAGDGDAPAAACQPRFADGPIRAAAAAGSVPAGGGAPATVGASARAGDGAAGAAQTGAGVSAARPAGLRSLGNPAPMTNLPAQPTSFIGRDRELAEVRALVQSSRLVTLTGPGGTRKTRLGLEVAAGLLDGCRDGVWLVELRRRPAIESWYGGPLPGNW
jgi:hypothetical protein